MAEKPKKASRKSVLKLPTKLAAKVSNDETQVQGSVTAAEIAANTTDAVAAPKSGGVTKARKPSAKKPPAVQLPRFDPATDWSAARWINDPPLLAKIRAAMIPETISYPEALPDTGRATLFRFEAGYQLVSEVAPLEVGATYALATRRDGTFLLYRES